MTIVKQPNQRVGIFIDVQNLYHSAKNLYDAKVNFENLVRQVVGDRSLIRSIGYVISTESKEESGFFGALVKMGIETKSKELLIYGDSKKADWDVGIAVDMIALATKLDVIVLVSGDGDFIPALEYIKQLGCQIEVVAFSRSCSSKLRAVSDDFIDLCESPRQYLIKR